MSERDSSLARVNEKTVIHLWNTKKYTDKCEEEEIGEVVECTFEREVTTWRWK